MSHGTEPTILLIEADRSLRRLIVLGLQYRGMHIIEADSLAHVNIPQGQSPALLVLDIDSGVSSDWSLLDALHTLPELSTIPVVVLTWEALVPAGMAEDVVDDLPMTLTKPFDARALYEVVEHQLAMLRVQQMASTRDMSEIDRTGRAVSASSSIWPLLTAAGLLLAFIGLMGPLCLIIIGLCIALVSLLLWTLGKKPEQAALPV